MSHTEVSLRNPRLRVKPLVKSLDRLLRAFDMLLYIELPVTMLAYFPLTGQGSHFYLEYQYLPVRYIENVCLHLTH